MNFYGNGRRNDALFQEISPLRVANYLRSHGWREERKNDRVAIWTLLPPDAEPDDYFEILLPFHPEYRDFARLMGHLFGVLEEAEQRNRKDILASLTYFHEFDLK